MKIFFTILPFLLLNTIILKSQNSKCYKKNAIPIYKDSLSKKADFSKIIADFSSKKIVLLGESAHGVKEYANIKSQLIKYLYENSGFDVILFENDINFFSFQTSFRTDDFQTCDLLKNNFYKIYNNNEVSQLLDYFHKKNVFYAGIDPQIFIPNTSRFNLITSFFQKLNVDLDSIFYMERKIRSLFNYYDSEWKRIPTKTNLENDKDALIRFYNSLCKKAKNQDTTDSLLSKLVTRVLYNRLRTIGSFGETELRLGKIRDSLMAENIIWYSEVLFPDKKILVWSADAHVRKACNYFRPDEYYMGKIIFEKLGNKAFFISINAYKGKIRAVNIPDVEYYIVQSSDFERELSDLNIECFYLRLKNGTKKRKRNRCFDIPVKAYNRQTIIPSKFYDAVIFFQKVTPMNFECSD